MNLDDLLAEVDGLGGDRFVPSAELAAAAASREGDTGSAVSMVRAEGIEELPTDEAASLSPLTEESPDTGSLEMVLDVELELQVELGQARVPLKELMRFRPGDQFVLDRRPEEPVRLYVSDRLIAHGEAFIVDGSLAVKVTELVAPPAAKGGERI